MSTRLHFALSLVLAAPLAFPLASAVAEPPVTARPPFAYEADPYYPHRDYPKLTTPQWVGEEGVEGVVVLAVDDMSKPAIYETFLRPILDRLKAIDGRAPLSIMTNQVDPNDPRIQGWLKEGLSIEIHTIGHPCPFFHDGDFDAASRAYHGCVDLINKIPNNRPVAFRMPCCDSINSPGPRFYAELFNKTSPGGNFLTIDTSVFNIPTPDDPSVPRTSWSTRTAARSSASTFRSSRSSTRSRTIRIPTSSAASAGSSPARCRATGKARTSTSRTTRRRWKT
jgi:hypothetical protein